MPYRILSPYSVQGIQRQLVVPGPYSPVLGEELYATQDVGDYAGRSPYATRRIGSQTQGSAAAGVGVYSGLLVRPGAGTIFVIEQVILNTGATLEAQLRLCRPADVALLTIVLATPFGCLNEPVAGSGFIPTLGATLTSVNRNALGTGGLFAQIRFPANTNRPYEPPRGIPLRGDNAAAATALLIQNITDDALINATIYGTEYVAPPAQIP